MASQLKDIQFTSPVLNGTTANNKTTWTYGANDVVVFGYGLSGCGYSEMHYGCEYHSGTESHYGDEYHCGYEYHYSDENHSGFAYFSANCGCGDYAGAGIAVTGGIAFQGGSGQVILLNYTTLSQHGF